MDDGLDSTYRFDLTVSGMASTPQLSADDWGPDAGRGSEYEVNGQTQQFRGSPATDSRQTLDRLSASQPCIALGDASDWGDGKASEYEFGGNRIGYSSRSSAQVGVQPAAASLPPLSQSPCGTAVNPGSAASAGANAINQGQFNFLPSSNGVFGPGLPENVPPRSGSALPGASPGTSSFSFITTASSSTLPGLTRTDSSTDGLLGQAQMRNCQLELQLEQREQELQNARTQAQQSNSEAARLQGELLQLQGRLEVAVTAVAGFESAFRALIATTRHLVAQRATEDIRVVFEQQMQTLTMSTVDLKVSLETVSQSGSGVVTVPLVSEWGRGADGLSSSESPPASARPLTAASGTGLRRTSSSMEEEAAAVRLQARARGNLERHSIERREKLSHELLQSEGTYLAGLRVVIDGYWRPLQHALNAGHEMVTGLQQADLQRIFSEVQVRT